VNIGSILGRVTFPFFGGTRPARLVVGQSFGADAINAQAVSIHAQLMEGLGLGQFAEPRMDSAAA
jgi:hypothetical protein